VVDAVQEARSRVARVVGVLDVPDDIGTGARFRVARDAFAEGR
jgi:hypothetical protein